MRTPLSSLAMSLLLAVPFHTTATAQTAAPSAYTGPKDALHIYLLIGQSNMAGRAPFTTEESGEMDRCYLLNAEDRWEAAKNPLNRHSTIRKGLGMQKMNPGYTFSETMIRENVTISIGLVVNAKGGSSIRLWAKGTQFYNEALRRAKQAEATGVLKGILWHQGESDHKDAEYLDKLTALVTDLREDLGTPDLPFVAGQILNVPLINDQIARLPETVPHTAFVSSDGLKGQDRWHFDADSMKILGTRYAEQMRHLQSLSKPTP